MPIKRTSQQTLVTIVGVACLVLVTAPVTAQPTTPSPAADGPGAGYRIGPGDLLSLQVAGVEQLEWTARVSNGGKLSMPHLGMITVRGLTPAELEAEAGRLFLERGLIKEPWVSVRIEQYRAQPVYILGEVAFPGQFVMKDEMYLMDLITLGGGFNDKATSVGYLYRRRVEADGTSSGQIAVDEALEIDFQALNDGERPDLNYRLQGGDVLYVPERRVDNFYVVGDVHQPGVFEFEVDERAILTSHAVAKAGGPLRTAKLGDGVLVRVDENGQHVELPMDIKAIFEGRRPEILIRPDDIIFIPGSTAKTFAYGLLGAVPSVAGQAVLQR